MAKENYWSQYWQQGNKTSFGDKHKHGYEGGLKKEWGSIFSKFKPGCSVIDLCTGNLSLIRMASQFDYSFADINFTGVDYANIVTDDFVHNNDNVVFLTGINIEKIDCEDKSFDHVISNFGIEYSNIERSIIEIARILKKNGSINIICHHQSSDLIKKSKKELIFITDLLKNNRAIDKLECFLEAIISEVKPEKSDNLRDELNSEMSSLLNIYGSYLYSSEFMAFFKYIFSKDVTDKLTELHLYKDQLLGYQSRITAMVNAALNEQSILAINKMLTDSDISLIDQYLIKEDEVVVGYKITAEKLL